MSRLRMFLYCSRCMGESCVYTMSSVFGGMLDSTSTLMRRSRKGLSTRCSWVITSCSTCLSLRSNHESKSSELVKTSGMRKLSSAHSSCRLFWMGVPVRSTRCAADMERAICARREFSFLSLCASSTTRKAHEILRRGAASSASTSYVVTQTLKVPGRSSCCTVCWRASLSPCSLTTLSAGHHFANSRCQLPSTESGTMTRCGLRSSRSSVVTPRTETVCSVLPRPISSARIPLSLREASASIQLRPSIW
mmetsp:Transcript_19762/g.49900  ORF Transcript_19762/g.49900 Transcript_19762/m.49900 type:complete len:250 (+) Transcript_19762:1043-1792(+)